MVRSFLSRVLGCVPSFRSAFQNRVDLVLENMALRHQVAVLKDKKKRPVIREFDRLFWVGLCRLWSKWQNALILVKPETVVRWHREGFKRYWYRLSMEGKKNGRPKAYRTVRDLIRQMGRENPTWGAPRIHGELLKLGFKISERTVSRYLPRREPDPDKVQRWMVFLRNHREAIAAMDFFTVPAWGFRLLYVFFIIHHDRRKILHFNVTFNPTAEWVIQQLREAFPIDSIPKYLIFDRDSIFSRKVVVTIKSFGMKPVRTSYRSPWQSGIAERWVGSCRRELLDHVVVLNVAHLYRLVKDYIVYYHEDRTHYALAKDSPIPRAVMMKPPGEGTVVSQPRVGGLHHRYEWREAA